jgi:dsRNA-specific ribonuclease
MDNLKYWVDSFEEKVYLIFVSFDKDLINNAIDTFHNHKDIIKIVLPIGFIKETYNQDGKSSFLEKYPGKVIVSTDYGKEAGPCIFFGDFVGTDRITPKKFNFYDSVEMNRTYRTFCRGVTQYRFNGNPQLNGYWLYEKSIIGENGNLIFLKRSQWAIMVQNKPLPLFNNLTNIINITSNVQVSKDWLDSVKILIRYLLTNILKTDIYNDILTDDFNMTCWIKCFIHETFNIVYGYQSLEFLGDSIMGTKFDIYMISKYPRMKESEFTEYHNQYMSAEHQSYLSEDIGLPGLLLRNEKIIVMSKKIQTDILESFTGALYQTCQTINQSLAEIASLNFLTLIGEQFRFDHAMAFGKPIHRVTQILQSLGLSYKTDLDITIKSVNKGAGVVDTASIYASNKFIHEINNLIRDGRDISPILKFTIDYDPSRRQRGEIKDEMMKRIDESFRRVNLDRNFTIGRKNTFISDLSNVDNNLYGLLCDKLSKHYGKYPLPTVISRIHFESKRHDENSYVIMYINTFEAAPNSVMLRSLYKYKGPTHKAGDDYIEEMDEIIQIKNLASVPMPALKKEEGPLAKYNTNELAQYYAVQEYVYH